RVGHGGQATGPAVVEAHEPDQIGAIAVEGQGDAAELVAASGRIVEPFPLVDDVAEHVTVLVLRPGEAEVSTDAPVQELHLFLGVRRAVDAAQAHEAPAVDQLALDDGEPRLQRGQRKVVLGELEDFVRALERVAQRGVELVQLGVGEALGPDPLVGDIGGGPLALPLGDAGRAHRVTSAGSASRPRTTTREPTGCATATTRLVSSSRACARAPRRTRALRAARSGRAPAESWRG